MTLSVSQIAIATGIAGGAPAFFLEQPMEKFQIGIAGGGGDLRYSAAADKEPAGVA
ncbi:hypothetical protein [Paenibacillus doosanensis]|uniref:hypothetical protein n=1 Tax=Paenibacillus doosanensis TaxID=1229154 RepID=UPI00217FF9CC|nr:hypothetical protein [Paenibacillus doosanensis]